MDLLASSSCSTPELHAALRCAAAADALGPLLEHVLVAVDEEELCDVPGQRERAMSAHSALQSLGERRHERLLRGT